MPLIVDWGHLVELSTVGLPILLASLLLAVLLHRSWRRGTQLPPPANGGEVPPSAPEVPPEILLIVFAALCFTALLLLLDTAQFTAYVLPAGMSASTTSWLLLLLVGTCVLGAAVLAASLLQFRIHLRHRFFEFALVGSAFGLVVVGAAPPSAPLAVVALVPVALLLGFVGAVLWRADSTGRFPIGLRSVALSILPLYLLGGAALIRLIGLLMLAR